MVALKAIQTMGQLLGFLYLKYSSESNEELTLGSLKTVSISETLRGRINDCATQIRAYDAVLSSGRQLTATDVSSLRDSSHPGGLFCLQVLTDQLQASQAISDIARLYALRDFHTAREMIDLVVPSLLTLGAQLRVVVPEVYEENLVRIEAPLLALPLSFRNSICLDYPAGFTCSSEIAKQCYGLQSFRFENLKYSDETMSLNKTSSISKLRFVPGHWTPTEVWGSIESEGGFPHTFSNNITDEFHTSFVRLQTNTEKAVTFAAKWVDSALCLREISEGEFNCFPPKLLQRIEQLDATSGRCRPDYYNSGESLRVGTSVVTIALLAIAGVL